MPPVFGGGPDGACGVVPPPFPAWVGLDLCFRAAATARAADTGGAAVGPNEEMFATEFADVRVERAQSGHDVREVRRSR